MFDVSFIDIFDAKIVDYQGKRDQSSFVPPQAWCMCTLLISKWCKFALELFVCKDACLWQSPYCSYHFQMDKAMQHMLVKVVLFDNPFREEDKGHFHILEVFKHGHQAEVFYVKAHVSGKGSADDAVPMEFGCIQVCCVHRCT
jgi:hypothetical protein